MDDDVPIDDVTFTMTLSILKSISLLSLLGLRAFTKCFYLISRCANLSIKMLIEVVL